MNPFLFDKDQYERNLDIKQGYVEHTAKYISLLLKKPYKECFSFVMGEMKNRNSDFSLKDPPMLRLISKTRGNRVEDETTFLEYIDDIIQTNRIVSPSFVVYERPEVEKSVTGEWLDDNIAARKRSKKAMFEYKQAGELMKSILADYDQNARKIRINSVSGMRGFKGCPIFLATGHSSLTSSCRSAAGYGNATVERFLAGSRHYHSPEIAKANLVAQLMIEDKSRIEAVIIKYGLKYPSVDDVMGMVSRSTDLYWRIPHETDLIRNLVEGMTDLERAVVCYSGDMFHLAMFNKDMVMQMFMDLIAIDLSDVPDVNPDDELKGLDATETAYINALCANILKGSTHKRVKEENPEGWSIIGKTAWKVKYNLNKYADIINALFAPKHLPPTIASLKSVQRRAGLAADTDSSIFTVEYWVHWVTGNYLRGEIQDRIWSLATYMVCQCIAHSLAMLSSNLGVSKDMLFRLAMKNEYGFPQFALTNLAKHYYSNISMREGNVYEHPEIEIKGVELRGSTAPKHVLTAAEDFMKEILAAVDKGEKLSAKEVLNKIAGYELETIRSVKRGEYTYLRSDSIKPETKKMCYHELWSYVFAPKYGSSVEPPYPCVKVTTDIKNKTALNKWVEEIEDRELAKRLAEWLVKYNRDDLKTILLPTMAIRACGLPIEIQQAVDIRKLTYQVNSGFYRILESTGLFIVDRNNFRLVFDFLGLEP